MKKTVIRSSLASIILAAAVFTNQAVFYAANSDVFIEVLENKKEDSNRRTITVCNIPSRTSAVQFDIKNQGKSNFTDMKWDSAINTSYVHTTTNGNVVTFFIISENLPVNNNRITIGEAVFDGDDISLSEASNIKYLDYNLYPIETTAALENEVTGNNQSSGGGGGGGATKPKEEQTNKTQETKTDEPKTEQTKTENTYAVLNDISGHWAENSIQFVVSKGIMNGMGNNVFEPNGAVTRAMVVKILLNLEEKLTGNVAIPNNGGFQDVPKGMWYTDAVNWASANKIVSGMGDGLFMPDAPVTREQMAVILMNYMNYKSISLPEANESIVFSDASDISPWAIQSVDRAVKAGILSGKSNHMFDAKSGATRAEIASMFERIINNSSMELQ